MVTEKIYEQAWKADTFTFPAAYSFRLAPGTLDELLRQTDYVQSTPDLPPTTLLEMERFPSLQREVEVIKQRFLEQGYGFCVVTGLEPAFFSRARAVQRGTFYLLGTMLGTPLVQNIQGETLIEVSDKGQSMKTGGRYHDTKEGGSLHTDSPQFPHPPDYLGLLCYHPGKIGGKSKLVSAYTVHNYLRERCPDLLPVLYEPFHFDKRGDVLSGESPTTLAPIFLVQGEEREFRFRYLRDYIDQGQQRVQQPLTYRQQAALDALDQLLEDETLTVQTELQAGQILLNNNNTVVHGRTAFEDWPEEERKRIMLRLWIQKN